MSADRLLIVSPSPLRGDDQSIVDNALRHVESYAGKFAAVDLLPARGSLIEMASSTRSNRVLLLGTQLSRALPVPRGTNLDAVHMQGILRETRGGSRWISSPHPSLYSVPQEEAGKGKSAVTAANLIGQLVRHLELLKWGLPGWDDPSERVSTRVVRDRQSLAELQRIVERARTVAIDTETHDLRRIGNRLLTVQMGVDGRTGWVLPVGHAGSPLDPRVLRVARDWLREYFEEADPSVHVYANATFDLHQLTDWLKLRWYSGNVYDVQYGAFSLDENIGGRKILGFNDKGDLYGLERLCQEHGMFHYSTSPVKKEERDRIASLPFRHVAVYGALDAALPIRLMRMQMRLAKMRNDGMRDRPYDKFFEKVVLVEGRKTLQITQMEQTGLLVDREYTSSLTNPNSEFQREIRRAEEEWNRLPEVREANRRLLKRQHSSGRVLFGDQSSTRRALDVGKPEHKQLLFFEVCGMTPQKIGKNGMGSLDDKFKKANREVPIIKAYSDLEEARKLYGTFIVGYHEAMVKSPDCRDGRLRTSFNGKLVTSRLSSVAPNLQNMPSRLERAKLVKRQFVSKRGRLFRKRDFSAHEVRMLGITARDQAMSDRFWAGMQTRLKYEYERTISSDQRDWWKKQLDAADVHKQNYGMIYGVDPTTVTKDQRGGIKATIFAASYGLSTKTLAGNLALEEMTKLEDRHSLARNGNPKKKIPPMEGDALREELRKIEDAMEEVRDRDWYSYAKSLEDLIFRKKFRVAGNWLEFVQRNGEKTTHALDVLGGCRHLYGYLHPQRFVRSACNRRGPNSAIQGPSSNLGLLAGYFFREMVWEWFVRRGVEIDSVQCNAVHDSTEAEAAIVQIPLLNYIEHHAFTTRIHRFMRGTMGHACNVGLESDVEVGASLAQLEKADRWDALVDAIRKGIEWGNTNLRWDLPVERLMRAVEHNARIIHGIRRREIEYQLRGGHRTNYYMEMTAENSLDYGLIHYVDIGEDDRIVGSSVDTKSGRVREDPARVEWRRELTRV